MLVFVLFRMCLGCFYRNVWPANKDFSRDELHTRVSVGRAAESAQGRWAGHRGKYVSRGTVFG